MNSARTLRQAGQTIQVKCGPPPVLPERLFFEALLYIARTGIPRRDLPSEFGSWDAVYNRLQRWMASGSLARLFELLTDKPELGSVKRILIDATYVRGPSLRGRRGKKRGLLPTKGCLVGAAAV